jgi:26S proteasome non-ATPase regulatory subunit 5
MDQSVEHDKASNDAKYELVKALANSKTIAEIFGNPSY